MPLPPDLLELPGSARRTPPGAQRIGPANPEEVVEVTLLLRGDPRRASLPSLEELAQRPLARQTRLSRETFSTTYGAREDDLAAVATVARAYGLRPTATDLGRRTVRLAGPVRALSATFGVDLARYRHPGGSFRGREGPLRIPAELHERVLGAFGLDNRPQAKTHFRVRPASAAGAPSYTPLEVAAAYAFPAGTDGTGQCIGLIELGGGYRPSDLAQYFQELGVPAPTVTDVSVDGGSNAPTGSAAGPDGEVELDLEVAGSLAPGARLAVYFAPNTDRGFLDALSTAVHDSTRRPTVISVSWGGAESSWTAQSRAAFESVILDAANLGVTIAAAAGDDGADDGGTGTGLAVDFPASSPGVIACGGTRLVLSGATILSEVVWNDLAAGEGATGGGVSASIPRPAYQSAAGVPSGPGGFAGRGVPDVAADADPRTGYQVLVDGTSTVIGGTSAVAPLWAALLARLNQSLGTPVGFVNPQLYGARASGTFRDIVSGANGGYSAGPGWDPCTGLGTPNGTALLLSLRTA
ncbi:MAG: S53 family peptidase [Thermoplasmata archaeon]